MMKKMSTMAVMVLMLVACVPAWGAMNVSRVRNEARFLTDRMAYELGLNQMQYDDVYEVNYDFIDGIRYLMDDVVRGVGYAMRQYDECLEIRNDDLRWILSERQYRRFLDIEYFSRPVYTSGNRWLFRIYQVYSDVRHFYFDKPHHYKTYKGTHRRDRHQGESYYKNHRREQYNHPVYQGNAKPSRPSGTKPGGVNRPKPTKENHSLHQSGKPNDDKVDKLPANQQSPSQKPEKVRKEETKRSEVKNPEGGRKTRDASSSRNATRTSETRRTVRDKR